MVRATEEPRYGFFVDDHIYACEALYEPAVPAAAVMLAALAGEEMTEVARYYLLHNLLCLVGDVGQDPSAPAGRDLFQECVDLVRSAEWLFYSVIAAAPGWRCASTAFEILDLIGADRERLRALITADPEQFGRDLCEQWSVTA